jgi:hypothetical protein
VAKGPRYLIAITFVIAILLHSRAQNIRNLLGYTRFFCYTNYHNSENFGCKGTEKRRRSRLQEILFRFLTLTQMGREVRLFSPKIVKRLITRMKC